MRNCFQSPLEGHSETSNDAALLSPCDHCITMKAYMTVRGGGDTLPQGRLSPSIDYVQKLQMTRLFSIPLIIT